MAALPGTAPGLFSRATHGGVDDFTRSNKNFHEAILIHYLQQPNNCLDYAAYCQNQEICGYTIHPSIEERLKRHNVRRDPQEQVKQYQQLAKAFSSSILRDISSHLSVVGQGGLLRLAFDLQVGGVFYYLFEEGGESTGQRFLFGATVDQQSMDDGVAYREMEAIFGELGGRIWASAGNDEAPANKPAKAQGVRTNKKRSTRRKASKKAAATGKKKSGPSVARQK